MEAHFAERDYGGHVMPCPVQYLSFWRYMFFGLCIIALLQYCNIQTCRSGAAAIRCMGGCEAGLRPSGLAQGCFWVGVVGAKKKDG